MEKKNNNAQISYQIYAKNAEDAIDIKNKILINTTSVETVKMDISISHAYIIGN